MNYIVTCGSTVDLTAEELKSRDIAYIPFHYFLNETEHLDDLGQSITYPEFYARMVAGEMTRTSQPSVGEYVEFFRPFAKEGKNILHVEFSSGLSGALQSSTLAAQQIEEEYPGVKVIVVDSLAASSGYGLLMDKVADLRDEGKSMEEIAAWVEEHRLEMHHWFYSSDLTFYIRGGRVSKVAGFFGNLLHICPVLHVDDAGKLIPMEKAHGAKKASANLLSKMQAHAQGGADYDGKVYLSCSNCPELANPLAEAIKAAFPKMKGEPVVHAIGTVIGAHSGPGTVAVFFWGDKNR